MEEADEKGFGDGFLPPRMCAGMQGGEVRGGTANGEIDADRDPKTGG
jgi:hypothetical protein